MLINWQFQMKKYRIWRKFFSCFWIGSLFDTARRGIWLHYWAVSQFRHGQADLQHPRSVLWYGQESFKLGDPFTCYNHLQDGRNVNLKTIQKQRSTDPLHKRLLLYLFICHAMFTSMDASQSTNYFSEKDDRNLT